MARRANTISTSESFKPYKIKQGEDYMSSAQRDHFRMILRDWRTQLMQDADNTVIQMKTQLTNHADLVDNAAQEINLTWELRKGDRKRKLIKKIEKSLDEIDSDDYGYCEECGAEIGLRRLEARPTATKCIDCKTFAEIREKHMLV